MNGAAPMLRVVGLAAWTDREMSVSWGGELLQVV